MVSSSNSQDANVDRAAANTSDTIGRRSWADNGLGDPPTPTAFDDQSDLVGRSTTNLASYQPRPLIGRADATAGQGPPPSPPAPFAEYVDLAGRGAWTAGQGARPTLGPEPAELLGRSWRSLGVHEESECANQAASSVPSQLIRPPPAQPGRHQQMSPQQACRPPRPSRSPSFRLLLSKTRPLLPKEASRPPLSDLAAAGFPATNRARSVISSTLLGPTGSIAISRRPQTSPSPTPLPPFLRHLPSTCHTWLGAAQANPA